MDKRSGLTHSTNRPAITRTAASREDIKPSKTNTIKAKLSLNPRPFSTYLEKCMKIFDILGTVPDLLFHTGLYTA